MFFLSISETKLVANLSAYRNELFYTQEELTAFRHSNRDLVIQRVRASGMTMAEFTTIDAVCPVCALEKVL